MRSYPLDLENLLPSVVFNVGHAASWLPVINTKVGVMGNLLRAGTLSFFFIQKLYSAFKILCACIVDVNAQSQDKYMLIKLTVHFHSRYNESYTTFHDS